MIKHAVLLKLAQKSKDTEEQLKMVDEAVKMKGDTLGTQKYLDALMCKMQVLMK